MGFHYYYEQPILFFFFKISPNAGDLSLKHFCQGGCNCCQNFPSTDENYNCFPFLKKIRHEVLLCSHWADYLTIRLSLRSGRPHRSTFYQLYQLHGLGKRPKDISLFIVIFYLKAKICLSLLGQKVQLILHTFVAFTHRSAGIQG